MTRAVEALLFEHYGEVAAPLLGPMLDWLLAVRRHCRDDLDLFLIFSVVALRTFGDPRAATLDFAAVDQGELERYPSLLTNTRSIAASTGIPYETTRRKVEKLLELGWVERRVGGLALTTQASINFSDARRRMLAMVASHHAATAGLLARKGD
jgi:hypothetical protein